MAQNWLDQLTPNFTGMPVDQGQLNMALMAQNQAPPMPMPRANPGQPVQMLSNVAVQKPPMTALSKYIPAPQAGMSPQSAGYSDLSKKALQDQSNELEGLNKYIEDLANKPQGINFQPLASFIDNLTGSKLSGTAKDIAPMGEDDRDKMLFGLKQQLAQGQARLSSSQLQALKEQQAIEQHAADAAERNRHNLATENKSGNLSDARMMQALTAKDNQTSKAVDGVVNNKLIQGTYIPRIDGSQRILDQIGEVRSGHLVDTPQFLADLSLEHSNLLAGANNAALGKLERTEYKTYAGDLGALMQRISKNPTSINSPEIINHLEKVVQSLQNNYRKNVDVRAESLRRTFLHNDDATKQMGSKIDEIKNTYGTKNAPAPTPKIKVSNGQESFMIDPGDLDHATKDGYQVVK